MHDVWRPRETSRTGRPHETSRTWRHSAVLSILLILIISSAFPAAAARRYCGDNISWELSKNGVLRLTGIGPMKDYYYDDTPWHPDLVKVVEIDDRITHIGRHAFAKCRLITVSIPPSVETIGRGAFKNCRQLENVRFSYGLRLIEMNAFEGCSSLEILTIPMAVAEIGKDAFKGCKSLTEIREIPEFVMRDSELFGLSQSLIDKYRKNIPVVSSFARPGAQTYTPSAAAPAAQPSAAATSASETLELISDIDTKVPERPRGNVNTFALVIANEHYSRLADVPFAERDGSSFANYCRTTLGLPDTNVMFFRDATYGNINEGLLWLREIDEVYDGKADFIIYYAGHGVPDDSSSDAFIVPVDAAKPSRVVCYPLQSLYAELGSLKAGSVSVFLDACFSGATRSDAMIAEGRGVAIKPRQASLTGNVMVMTATSDDQTAWQYEAQGHGLFTYFLLKKLQETRGDVTLGELSDYVTENVRRVSTVVNRKRQQPTVTVSSSLADVWRSRRLR